MGIDSLTATEAFLIALSGMLIIFMMLGCLAGLITIISKIVQQIEHKDVPVSASSTPASTQESSALPLSSTPKRTGDEIYGGEIQLIDVDERTAVCIMAIVSDETGIDLSELVFKKIRAL